jgi:hypothetical protein
MPLRRLNKIGLALFAGVLLWCCSASIEAASGRRPNIIFIFVDDQGYYDLGCYGATEVKTPRIDAMAKAGMQTSAVHFRRPCPWARRRICFRNALGKSPG